MTDLSKVLVYCGIILVLGAVFGLVLHFTAPEGFLFATPSGTLVFIGLTFAYSAMANGLATHAVLGTNYQLGWDMFSILTAFSSFIAIGFETILILVLLI